MCDLFNVETSKTAVIRKHWGVTLLVRGLEMASLIEYNLQRKRKRPSYFLLTFKITTFNALFSRTVFIFKLLVKQIQL